MSGSAPLFDRLAIVGVGLIGGSIGLAARARNVSREIIGIGRNLDRIEAARCAGVIDSYCPGGELRHADLVVVCTPVDRVADDAIGVLRSTDENTLVTDGGSIKGAIIDAIPPELRPRFVGAHPLAGSHLTGFENASADLYDGRLCVLTPLAENPPTAVTRVRTFWQSLGMRVRDMSPADHDAALARTSHFPHLAAAVVAAGVSAQELPLAAGGFRDTTRVAQGDPELWSAIFELNAPAMQTEIDAAISRLAAIRTALAAGHRRQVTAFLREAQQLRSQFSESSKSTPLDE